MASGTDNDNYIQALLFSTNNIEAGSQFDFWRDLFSHITDLLPPDPEGVKLGYRAQSEIYNIGHIVAVKISSQGARLEHSNQIIHANQLDHWVIVAFQSGFGFLRTFDRERRIEAGEIEFINFGRPFNLLTSDHVRTNFHVPQDFLPATSGQLENFSALQLTRPLYILLNTYLQQLVTVLPQLSTADMPQVSQATKAILATCFKPTQGALVEVGPTLQATMLHRARKHIQSELASPTLSSDSLCRLLGISRATLYRLFAPVGGVDKYIRQQRLVASHRQLSRGEAKSIKHVWSTYGFSSASDFHRSFKRQFGYSPSDAYDLAFMPRKKPETAASEQTLEEFRLWVRSLNL